MIEVLWIFNWLWGLWSFLFTIVFLWYWVDLDQNIKLTVHPFSFSLVSSLFSYYYYFFQLQVFRPASFILCFSILILLFQCDGFCFSVDDSWRECSRNLWIVYGFFGFIGFRIQMLLGMGVPGGRLFVEKCSSRVEIFYLSVKR